MARILIGVISALMLHTGFVLFGGYFFPGARHDGQTVQEVDLLGDEPLAPLPEEEPKEPEDEEEIEDVAREEPPDAAELLKNLDVAPQIDAPELEAASLSALAAALDGQGGTGGDFAETLSFASGGRIGGMGGKDDGLREKLEGAFSLSEIDQKPRAIFQATATYPAALRSKKLEGVVTVIFVVDAVGKVQDPRVEKASLPAFEKPALDAVKKWKFEPAVKAGERVSCKMRVGIRFQP
ncbi:MAG: energy transducer TonB [Phycisphaerae bacterium]|nr:energy transducer TonB [Phycisphaerae bacterium]